MRAYPGQSIRQGSKGDNVRLVQQVVGAHVDGDFGPKTHLAVIGWQGRKALLPDGSVGPKTWAKMFP